MPTDEGMSDMGEGALSEMEKDLLKDDLPIKRTSFLSDRDRMPFGTHKDKFMAEVPARYLDWLHGELAKDPNPLGEQRQAVYDYIKRNRNAITRELGLNEENSPDF